MGRHVSDERGRALRGATAAALAGIVALTVLVVFAVYGIVSQTHEPQVADRTGATAATSATTIPFTLTVTVTGPQCQVFVRIPGSDILLNRSLGRGEVVRFDEPRLDVVVSDAGAVRVDVNGRPRTVGGPGQRAEFTALKEP